MAPGALAVVMTFNKPAVGERGIGAEPDAISVRQFPAGRRRDARRLSRL